MAHNIPTFKRIEQLKEQAKVAANLSHMICQGWLNEQWAKSGAEGLCPVAKNNYKFYARLLGLRGGDLNGPARS